MKKLKLENRIALLRERGTDSGRIIKKLERQLRNLQKNESEKNEEE